MPTHLLEQDASSTLSSAYVGKVGEIEAVVAVRVARVSRLAF